jgi:secondary thiamine-phosphate synthase enzyme
MQATVQHQQHTLSIRTTGKSLHRFTGEVQQLVRASGIQMGLCHLFICHTSASLLIQENADPDVLQDLENFFAQLVPENLNLYQHIAEGADDMPAHIRSALTQTSETIPIRSGQLALGTWQGIYLWEHRQRGQLRRVVVHLTGC